MNYVIFNCSRKRRFFIGGAGKSKWRVSSCSGMVGCISKNAAIPNVEVFNILVPWGELLVGIGLLISGFTKTAVFLGMVMNFSYMFSGSTSTNPQLVLLSMFILVSAMNAGRYGIDGMIMPTLKEKLFANKTMQEKNAA
jgi:thiosulfate dehydrogenase [quinone] large subunit